MVIDTQSQQEAELKKPTTVRLISMDDKSTSGTALGEGFCSENWCKAVTTAFPQAEKFYSTNVKPTIDALKKKSEDIPFSYQTIEQEAPKLHLVHGLFLMIFGGSWVWVANLKSFCVVYDVFEVVGSFKEKGKGAHMKTRLNSLHQLWLLMVVYYAVCTAPLLSNVTVAFMLEKYVTATVYTPAIMARVEKQLPLERMFGRWCSFVVRVAIRVVLVILSVFTYRIQVCLVMTCVGFHRLYASLPAGLRKQILRIEGPFKLDGKAVVLWASAIVCTAWQFWSGYECSFFGIIVPLGFLIQEKKLKGI